MYCSLFSCAKIIPPTGGDKDTDAPVMDTLASSPNFQTNYRPREIEFVFDEWLQLKDVIDEVVVSPPLVSNLLPRVYLKKKSVFFEFPEDEVLRENATYVINFGDAVRDLNEGNIVSDLRYVFSTGQFIDSLEVRGKIIDALTGEPAKEVSVFLYDNLSDTVPRTQKPFYLSKTDERGIFQIRNIKPDTFQVFATVDEGTKNIFDPSDLKLAFLDSFIVVDASKKVDISLRLFERAPRLFFPDDEQERFGWVKLVFNQAPPEGLEVRDIGNLPLFFTEIEKDTVHLWYDKNTDGRFNVFVGGIDSLFDDTLSIKNQSRAEFIEVAKLRSNTVRGKPQSLKPRQALEIEFNHPVQTIDTSKITLLEDTLKIDVQANVTIDSTFKRKIIIDYPWKAGTPYQFLVDSLAITDMFGLSSDPIFLNLTPYSLDDFGDLDVKISEMPIDTGYVIQLFFKKQQIEEFYSKGDSVFEFKKNGIDLGSYSLRIVEDLNGNKKWDSGDFDLKRQAEYIYEKQIDEIRSGWEVQTRFTIADLRRQRTTSSKKGNPEIGDNEIEGQRPSGKRPGGD